MIMRMFPKVKGFQPVKHSVTCFIKLYCNDRAKNLQTCIVEKKKKSELLPKSVDIITENYEECAKFEEKVVKQVLIEKERDANLQSQLSKDCKILFSSTSAKKSPYGKCDSIHLDQTNLLKDYQELGSYTVDHLQLKSVLETSESSKTDDTSPITGSAGGKDRGGMVTAGTPVRPVRQAPGKVIFCFIPEEWWRFFIPKTGVTGFGTFLCTFSTFLVSKEIYVLEHNYYHGLGTFFLWIAAIKYIGPIVSKNLDKDLDQFEKDWNEGREDHKKSLEEDILHELLLQYQSEGQVLLLDAKRENIQLQLEEQFRKRQMYVYQQLKNRLDYHVELELVKKRIQQKNLVEYVTREVKQAITPELHDKLIYYSIQTILVDIDKLKK